MHRRYMPAITLVVSFFFLAITDLHAQDAYTDLDPSTQPGAAGPEQNTAEAILSPNGELLFFSDIIQFEDTCPDLSLETFEDTNVPPEFRPVLPRTFRQLDKRRLLFLRGAHTGFFNRCDPGQRHRTDGCFNSYLSRRHERSSRAQLF